VEHHPYRITSAACRSTQTCIEELSNINITSSRCQYCPRIAYRGEKAGCSEIVHGIPDLHAQASGWLGQCRTLLSQIGFPAELHAAESTFSGRSPSLVRATANANFGKRCLPLLRFYGSRSVMVFGKKHIVVAWDDQVCSHHDT